MRWQHPTRGLLLPSEFIPLAEETGAIVELGDYVIEEACWVAARWPAGPRGELTVAVNLSARQLLSSDRVTRVSRALESSGLAPERLVLEITETSAIYDLEGAGWTLRLLAETGVHFALDDFGTGYSSLAYLVQLPIDRVKVDRSLVAGLPHTSGSRAVIAGLVGMTRAMGFHAIAEAVETEDQIEALNGLACHLAPGFFFSPPASSASWGWRPVSPPRADYSSSKSKTPATEPPSLPACSPACSSSSSRRTVGSPSARVSETSAPSERTDTVVVSSCRCSRCESTSRSSSGRAAPAVRAAIVGTGTVGVEAGAS